MFFNFEKRFSETFGYPYAAAANNGTASLHVSLLGAGVTEGDKVLTTPFSFIATTNAILYCRGIPIFVDVDEHSFNLSPSALRNTLKEHPDAKYLLLVHLFGQPCDMKEIMSIASEYSLTIIEDCAQAHGASYDGQPVGTFGIGGAFSFYPTKNMTTAEGGMIVSTNPEYAELCRKMINHGSNRQYVHDVLGFNYRMTSISAAIGSVQLSKIHDFTFKRKMIAGKYLAEINNDYITLPKMTPSADHVFHQFTIKTPFRNELSAHLKQNGVGYGIYYPMPLHKQQHVMTYANDRGFEIKQQPTAENLAEQVLSIPVHPQLEEAEVEHIVKVLNEFVV
ncbi:DegT/DnrJ/EryC1/StrS family aminotransferase [Neobacillus mesonae]|nr:DegT/DnrJ/EryC1/StrS family aminotransferase [Neobacillus mesonae]